ncbi:hypothetical protein [Escherichia coli]|uniref:hypothetical protein n=1 Tax=Escherichia coli TaxID=562 RepID=UPI003D65F5C3
MKIKNLKNKEFGKDIYIVANGHSANTSEIADKLNGKIVIGMNATPLLTEMYGLNIHYYTVSDERFLIDDDKYLIATKKFIRVLYGYLVRN